jgi:hypothetical protein
MLVQVYGGDQDNRMFQKYHNKFGKSSSSKQLYHTLEIFFFWQVMPQGVVSKHKEKGSINSGTNKELRTIFTHHPLVDSEWYIFLSTTEGYNNHYKE